MLYSDDRFSPDNRAVAPWFPASGVAISLLVLSAVRAVFDGWIVIFHPPGPWDTVKTVIFAVLLLAWLGLGGVLGWTTARDTKLDLGFACAAVSVGIVVVATSCVDAAKNVMFGGVAWTDCPRIIAIGIIQQAFGPSAFTLVVFGCLFIAALLAQPITAKIAYARQRR